MNSEVRIKNSLNKLIIASYISKNSLIDCSVGLVVVISPVLTLLWTYQSCCSVTVDTELKRERAIRNLVLVSVIFPLDQDDPHQQFTTTRLSLAIQNQEVLRKKENCK